MPSPSEPTSTFGQVVVVGGHMTDRPERAAPRFPASDEPAVAAALRAALRRWQVGPGTLILTAGARGADIIAAEQGLALGADVWLLMPMPEEQFVQESVHVDGGGWEERFEELRGRCRTWTQEDELGPVPDADDVFERNNEWCLAVATAQAPAGQVRALVVWDGSAGDGRGGAGDLAERARSQGAEVQVVCPPAAAGRRP